jgi:hypothetical protein
MNEITAANDTYAAITEGIKTKTQTCGTTAIAKHDDLKESVKCELATGDDVAVEEAGCDYEI